MELDLDTKQLLADLIARPELVTQAHAGMLTNLVKAYPYYQPLHLLLAKASLNDESYTNTLATAALYTNGTLLHQVIYQPETLRTVIFDQGGTTLEIEEISQPLATALADEQEVFEEIAEINPISTVENFDQNLVKEELNLDEQETYDEIVEVDATAFPTAMPSPEEKTETLPLSDTVPDELVIEPIVATDFFAFEKSFSPEQAIENTKEEVLPVVQPEEYNLEAEAQTVSKYDDDKLPYTFLWWLAKTRKEHAQIFQPYVTQKKNEDQNPSELQQQYVEHIFHIQTPFNVADEASKGPINRQVVPKGIDIIDSFIKNDPQIKVPKAEQINNENKAKKSAEDNYDLVSETLAAIYIEQMLYHKAIDTYEKLSLKFPEKSRYFADLIQSLEKKI